ncbi:hypothetical protein [Daejeonella sp. JGW-45]|uniref:hypothetical protein n=1 Tax=Daejeonella sp. JGW-45 TaxID=3034148 RepID=UPI0023EBEFDA|nr:hypothetical protein [Daejeonella sp. JGW-45]
MSNNNESNLRVIKTARSKEAINQAAKEGYWPLVKPVIPSPEIKTKYAVIQHSETGEIEISADFRFDSMAFGEKGNKVIDFTFYYPYHFENPYAAYLIPKDLKINEKVFLEDLIEDIVGSTWNQGDSYRLASSEAVWDGTNFKILENEKVDFIG